MSQCIAALSTKGNSKFALLVDLAKSNSAAEETLEAKMLQGENHCWVWLIHSQLPGVYMLIMCVVYKNKNEHHLKRLLYI